MTPITAKSAPEGFQHCEQPQAWLWRTFADSVTSTLLVEQWQWSFPPGKLAVPLVRPLSISGWREDAIDALRLLSTIRLSFGRLWWTPTIKYTLRTAFQKRGLTVHDYLLRFTCKTIFDIGKVP